MDEVKKLDGYEFEPHDPTWDAYSPANGPRGMFIPVDRELKQGYDWSPLICECGSRVFMVYHPEAYDTTVECGVCGSKTCVHSG